MFIECDALLADGAVAHLRPVHPGDLDELVALHEAMSPHNLYLRFFTVSREAARNYAQRLVDPPDSGHFALAAVLRGRIAGVISYERLGPDEAEVAVVVDDAVHGRGVATLLLEHVAHAARENGIRRLQAAVLPENAAMLEVTQHSGMRYTRRLEGGIEEIVIPLDIEAALLDAIDERDRVAGVHSLERVLRPRSVALIGVGRSASTIGRELLRNLLRADFTGPIYPIHPHADAVGGVPAYRSIADLPVVPDLAVIALRARAVSDAVKECGERGVRGVVVLSGGFADAGPAGALEQRQVLEVARAAGMRVIGPNCLGLLNNDRHVRLDATYAPTAPQPGKVAMLSQSGGLGIALLERASALGVGVSTFVSVGNKADVSGNDLLLWWEQDIATDLIVLYLESFGNPRRFGRIARRVSRSKPIVAVKGGRSVAGARAASKHTAAPRESSASVDALFRQAGVIAVDSLGELINVVAVMAHAPLPAGPRIAVIGNDAGPGVLAADAATAAGLDVPELPDDVQERLRALLPPDASTANPVDVTGAVSGHQFGDVLDILLARGEIDAVVAVLTPGRLTSVEGLHASTGQVSRRTAKPVLVSVLGQAATVAVPPPPAVPVVSFAAPEEAVRALARAVEYGRWRRRPVGAVPLLKRVDAEAARRAVAAFLDAHARGGDLDEASCAELLACYGIEVTPDPPPSLEHELELSVGVTQDPVFGPLVTMALAGRMGRLLAEPAVSIIPLTDADAADLVRSPRWAPMLVGAPGSHFAPPVDVEAVEQLLLRVARLAEDLWELARLELDPVLARRDGAVVTAAQVSLAPATVRDDARRRLR